MADYIDLVHDIERVERLIRRQPLLRDRTNPFEMYDDDGFLYRFRVTRHMALELLQTLDGALAGVQNKVWSIPPMIQLLVTLQFYGSGTFLRNDADIFGIHISNVSRIITRCSRALAGLKQRYITFPQDDEVNHIQEGFHGIAGLPGVIGVIDCTHVPTVSPGGEQAELFRNRKGYFSINVQVIGDDNRKIRNVVA